MNGCVCVCLVMFLVEILAEYNQESGVSNNIIKHTPHHTHCQYEKHEHIAIDMSQNNKKNQNSKNLMKARSVRSVSFS